MTSENMEQRVFNNDYQRIQVRGADRRKADERRSDPRIQGKLQRVSFWLRSLVKPRTGIDRRKSERRETVAASIKSEHSSELTPEELKQLLD